MTVDKATLMLAVLFSWGILKALTQHHSNCDTLRLEAGVAESGGRSGRIAAHSCQQWLVRHACLSRLSGQPPLSRFFCQEGCVLWVCKSLTAKRVLS